MAINFREIIRDGATGEVSYEWSLCATLFFTSLSPVFNLTPIFENSLKNKLRIISNDSTRVKLSMVKL